MHTEFLVGNCSVKRPPGRPKRRWDDNIKMDVREVGCEDGVCSGSCLVAGFGVVNDGPAGSATREFCF